jgi:hypothetical protein
LETGQSIIRNSDEATEIRRESFHGKEMNAMAYTVEISQKGRATLRRLAWYRGKPMRETLEDLLEVTGVMMAESHPGKVCAKCRDKSICEQCPFNIIPTESSKYPFA